MQASDKTTVQEETKWLFIATQGSKEQKMNKSTDGHKENILELHHQYIVKHPLFWSPLLKYSPVVFSLFKNKGINTTAPLGREGEKEGALPRSHQSTSGSLQLLYFSQHLQIFLAAQNSPLAPMAARWPFLQAQTSAAHVCSSCRKQQGVRWRSSSMCLFLSIQYTGIQDKHNKVILNRSGNIQTHVTLMFKASWN